MMLYVAGEMVDAVARRQPLSPFHQARRRHAERGW
jgi:hypothetical protein